MVRKIYIYIYLKKNNKDVSIFMTGHPPSHQDTAFSIHLSNNALPHLLHILNMNVDTFYPIHCLPVSPKGSKPHTTSRCATVRL